MQKKWIKGARRALLFFLIGVLSVPVYASSTKDQLNDAEKDREDAKGRLEAVQAKVEELQSLREDAKAYIEAMDAELEKANTNLENLQAQTVAKEEEIRITEEELAVAREVEAEQYASMKLRIQFMYENGNQSYLDLLLNSSSIAELLNKSEYISQITEYDRKMLEEYQQTRADIEDKEARLLKEHEELEVLVAQAEEEKSALELLIESKSAQMREYENAIAASESEIAGMEEEVAALDNRIAQLEEKIRQETARVVYDGGQFLFPLSNYSRKATSDYGWRIHPIFGTSKLHNGIDFGSDTGTPIMAAYDGEVILSEYSSSAGNYIMINHGGGLVSVYMHCSKLIAQVGNVVSKGDVIGLVGSTGNSTGPHLHFSVRVNGEYVDPAPYIGYVR